MSRIIGEPVQVVKVNEDNKQKTLELDEDALSKILLMPHVRDKKIVVVSVAGAFRKGKSFLLDFFLRYMATEDTETWLEEKSKPLEGFHWRGGAERDTTGIVIWSHPFPVTLPSGEEVVVLFMDTQGSFDTKSTVKQCATIFALSTMLSSKQIYNIHGNLQEDNLQHLQFFTEYGRIALKSGSCKTPFQHLEFLIRDWSYPYEYPFGAGGGMKLLNSRLELTADMHAEHASLRRHIMTCFALVRCYLLPHPGLTVATNPTFDGRLSDIDQGFVSQLEDFVPSVLAPANLQVKEINGQAVTCGELLQYFKAYVKVYQGDTLPEPMSTLMATAEANNLNTLIKCRDLYLKEMNKVCGPECPYLDTTVVETTHNDCIEKAIHLFQKTPKMGDDDITKLYMERLKKELSELGDELRLSNANKNIFQHLRTPGIICVILVFFYIVVGIFDFVGLRSISGMLYIPLWMSLVSLLTWITVHYTGQAPGVGQTIDRGAEFLHQQVLAPLVETVGRRAVAQGLGIPYPS